MNFTSRNNIFNQNSPFRVNKNGFDLSHEVISSWDMGKLYPFPAKEVYPNDTIKTSIQWKMLLETLKKPIYSDLVIKFKNYGVAYRNLWKHWRNFYTRGRKGNFSAQIPRVNINVKSNVKGSIFDYLGFPVAYDYKIKDGKLYMKQSAQSIASNWGRLPIYVNAFPFIAYDFIYFWNFINSELQENIVYNIQDNLSNYTFEYTNSNIPLVKAQTDENNLFRYNVNDFYTNGDTYPTYFRLFDTTGVFNTIPSDYTSDVTFNSELGINDRYSFIGKDVNKNPSLPSIPAGVIFASDSSTIDSDGYKLQSLNTHKYSTYSSHDIINTGFLYNVNYERDYFTSAHLKKQLGDPIGFPVGFNAPVPDVNSTDYLNELIGVTNNQVDSELYSVDGSVRSANSGGQRPVYSGQLYTGNQGIVEYLNKNAVVSSFFMNDLRLVGAISMLQEGALMSPKTFEYSSYLQFFFGKSPNTKDLQQPYFIGGFNSLFYTQEVIQNSGSTDTSNQLGDYAGRGNSIDSGYFDTITHDEIGLELMVMYIIPKKTMQNSQGINRMWLRQDSYDYYNPVFAHLGFQEIQKQELYAVGDSKTRQEPFGYTMSWNELRYMSDVVTSDMRDSLSIWRLARDYKELPVLNSDYLICRPSKEIFDVTDITTPVITGRVNIVCAAYRDLPELGIPELFDHRY